MKSKVKSAIISGTCSVICAAISAWAAYHTGYKEGMLEISQKVNNEITQVVNVDNTDYLENLNYVLEKIESSSVEKVVEKDDLQTIGTIDDFEDVHLIDSSRFTKVENFQDSYGDFHEKAYEFYASDGAYAIFNLSEKYKSFSADIVAGPNTSSGTEMTINIKTDGMNIKTIRGVTKLTNMQHIEIIDMAGINTLEIVGSTSALLGGYFYLVNVELGK